MTNREQEILRLIRQNPLISQKELADALGITRSSAAVHIANLIKKGFIMGKGYLVKENPYVCLVGGANMDIQGFPQGDFRLRDSNPGFVKLSLGGVGRNIAENMARLGLDVKLITAVGGDLYGSKIIEEARKIGIDVEATMVLQDQRTSTYLSILDDHGDMQVAIADMEIVNRITPAYINEKRHIIENAQVCIVDTNLSQETIQYMVGTFKQTTFFLDTVSTAKGMKAKDIIGQFHTVKPNLIEAEYLTGVKIDGPKDLERAANVFLEKGVQQVFITMGKEGVYYANEGEQAWLKVPEVAVVNATGAGDAFTAALVYGYMNNLSINETARIAATASILAISHEDTINPYLSLENIKLKMEELKLC